jgi:hypothetical protein
MFVCERVCVYTHTSRRDVAHKVGIGSIPVRLVRRWVRVIFVRVQHGEELFTYMHIYAYMHIHIHTYTERERERGGGGGGGG